MKLFIDGYHLGLKKHGVQKFLSGLIDGLSQFNPGTKIFVGVKKTELEGLTEVFKGTSVVLMPYSTIGILRLIFDIPLILKKNKISTFYGQYFIPIFTSKSIRYFITVHDILYEDYPKFYSTFYILSRRYLINRSAKRSVKIFTISIFSKERLNTKYNIDLEKIEVIPIQIEAPKGEILKDEELIEDNIVYVSRFEERKNHERLISVFSKIPNTKSLTLILVGFDVDGTKEKCIQLTKDLGLSDRVIFLENIESNELEKLHVRSKVVIYPSLCEGLGMPILEALLANSRVLFSNTTSMGEFIFAKRHMFNPFDEEDMYAKLITLLDNPAIFKDDHYLTKAAIVKGYNLKVVSERYSLSLGLQDQDTIF
tara:strand:+ start:4728 stop:5831 length:1104 start_codon:yes stop_codon:yes gene_type:complete